MAHQLANSNKRKHRLLGKTWTKKICLEVMHHLEIIIKKGGQEVLEQRGYTLPSAVLTLVN